MKTDKYYKRKQEIKAALFYALLTVLMLMASSCTKDDNFNQCDCIEIITYRDRPQAERNFVQVDCQGFTRFESGTNGSIISIYTKCEPQ